MHASVTLLYNQCVPLVLVYYHTHVTVCPAVTIIETHSEVDWVNKCYDSYKSFVFNC